MCLVLYYINTSIYVHILGPNKSRLCVNIMATLIKRLHTTKTELHAEYYSIIIIYKTGKFTQNTIVSYTKLANYYLCNAPKMKHTNNI